MTLGDEENHLSPEENGPPVSVKQGNIVLSYPHSTAVKNFMPANEPSQSLPWNRKEKRDFIKLKNVDRIKPYLKTGDPDSSLPKYPVKNRMIPSPEKWW